MILAAVMGVGIYTHFFVWLDWIEDCVAWHGMAYIRIAAGSQP